MSQSKFKIDKKVILYLLLLAAALLFPMAANRRVLNIAIITLMYVTLGESWNLLSGMSGLFSIAHALFFGLGVYGMTITTNRLGMGLFAGVVMGLVVNTLMALLVGVIASKLSGLYFTMALIGLHQTVYSLSIQLIDLTGGSMGISMPREYLFSKTQQYYMVLTLAVASMLFYVFIRRSRIGTNFVALKENPDLARALGSQHRKLADPGDRVQRPDGIARRLLLCALPDVQQHRGLQRVDLAQDHHGGHRRRHGICVGPGFGLVDDRARRTGPRE